VVNIPETIDNILSAAKINLQKDGAVEPVAFIFREGNPIILPLNSIGDKYKAAGIVGALTRKADGFVAVTLYDAKTKTFTPEDAKAYDGSTHVIDMPDSIDCLVIQATEFPSGKNHTKVVTYTKQDEQYRYETLQNMSDAAGAISDALIDGWKRADLAIRIRVMPEGLEGLNLEEL
jgi:hypothetical protein